MFSIICLMKLYTIYLLQPKYPWTNGIKFWIPGRSAANGIPEWLIGMVFRTNTDIRFDRFQPWMIPLLIIKDRLRLSSG